MAFFQPGLRRAALNLSRASFCGTCMRTTLRTPTTATTTQSKILRLLNNTSKRYSSTQSPLESLSSKVRKPSATKAQSSSNSGSSKGPKSWPETNDKVVGYWLVGSAASVFGIVIFGGLTRLTESGYVLCFRGFRLTGG